MYGVLLKGALWFGIFGAIIGMSFTAMTGSVYAPSDIILFFAVMFPLRYLGILLFNHPHRPKKRNSPKSIFLWTVTRSGEGCCSCSSVLLC